ncbi:hypothetical protein F4801DRAFT_605321 [Xylaria longipes]|nr:hypothetical protein F4801DRAFT_605321 [Xylaria longipes]
MVNTQRHSKLTRETLAAPYSPAAELPGLNTHPVSIARLMLLFAIALQSPSRENLVALSEPHDALMHRLVVAATTWVTTQDEIHGTVDCLICPPPLKRIGPTLEVKPEVLWFRIVYVDRYLSLMFGVPQGTSDRSMGSSTALQQETPLGAFERRLTVIASRILGRNEGSVSTDEYAVTQAIDSELLKASQDMPQSFWRPANFQSLTPGSPETLLETVRLGAQVYYYGLLVQLHLPYTMRLRDNGVHEYSKITCINASREIMTRFITHWTFNPFSSCSRPVDFFALLAGMSLLLAHLDAHHNREAVNFLAHQHLSNRTLLSQALERMDVISKTNKDVITDKNADLLCWLLDIEADEGSQWS